jgi:hypothetical protein
MPLPNNASYRTNPRSPQAIAVCDRCGFWFNHCNMSFQQEWRGNNLTDIRLLVCRKCYDVPFQLNRPLVLPQDPPPIDQPRTENFAVDEA